MVQSMTSEEFEAQVIGHLQSLGKTPDQTRGKFDFERSVSTRYWQSMTPAQVGDKINASLGTRTAFRLKTLVGNTPDGLRVSVNLFYDGEVIPLDDFWKHETTTNPE